MRLGLISRIHLSIIAVLCVSTCIAQAQPLDDIVLSAWMFLQEYQTSQMRVSEYADAGFNLVLGLPGSTPAANKTILDNCERCGLKINVYDPRVATLQLNDPNFNATLDTVIADYGKHPALSGYFLVDEPAATEFARLGAINNYLLSKDATRGGYVNFFPNYATPAQLATPTYGAYIDQALSVVNPTYLSYDHYNQMLGYTGDTHFSNLEAVRSRTLTANKSFVDILLLFGCCGYRAPSAGDLRWQVYTALAYGSRGYMFFGYYNVFNSPDYFGIVDLIGNKTPYYTMVQQLNGEARNLAQTFVKLKSDKVYHTGYVPSGCSTLWPSSDIITSVAGADSLLGFFRDPGNARYVMVVNKDMQLDHTLTINFANTVTLYEVSKATGKHGRIGFGVRVI